MSDKYDGLQDIQLRVRRTVAASRGAVLLWDMRLLPFRVLRELLWHVFLLMARDWLVMYESA